MFAEIKFEVKLPIKIFKSETAYIGHCPILDVASQGDTPAEAHKNIIEALSLFLISCFEQGTLSNVLKESGFVQINGDIPPLTVDENSELVNIPLPFMVLDSATRQECHA
ncbi:MAG: hypothetical protein HQK79_22245 [Desulfobacterales bacterium]|nr:hypothetical protein [Desulfobacterales bacterium]MBF0398739.1 hypothetical protein [Desulfobacterales bacterium]